MSTRPNFPALVAYGAPRFGWAVVETWYPNHLRSLQTFTRGSSSVEVAYQRAGRLRRVTLREHGETLVVDQTVGAMKAAVSAAIFPA
jgi:hypothetical protein